MGVIGRPITFFVTGATGFIGSRLVAELVRQGYAVRALVRPTSSREGLEGERITVVEGDIRDQSSLQRGMEGCSAVFHLAAYAKNWARQAKMFFSVRCPARYVVLDHMVNQQVIIHVLFSMVSFMRPLNSDPKLETERCSFSFVSVEFGIRLR